MIFSYEDTTVYRLRRSNSLEIVGYFKTRESALRFEQILKKNTGHFYIVEDVTVFE